MIPGLGILRLAIVTAAFYVALAVVIELGIFVFAYLRGSAMLVASGGLWWLFFAFLWLLAFALAWHFVPIGPRRLQ